MRYYICLISTIAVLLSCSGHESRREKENEQQITDLLGSNTTKQEQPPVVKLFVENSSSMNGYFNQNAGAKDVRLSLFTLSKQLNCNSLFFINSEVIPAKKDAQTELQQLTLQDFIAYGKKGNVAASDISEVLNEIVTRTASNGEISLLVSDFIFCPSKKNCRIWLGPNAEKSKIESIFKGKDYSVAILQLEAFFSGTFFTGHFDDKGNEIHYKIVQKRPFYIWAIGGESEIDWFIRHVDLQKVGVENSLCIANCEKSLEYHLIPLKGVYDIDKRDNKHAENVKFGKSGFVLDFVSNIKSLPLSESYLFNKENYITNDENFAVDTIFESKGNTHIRVRGQKIKAGNVSVYLKSKLPSWVKLHSMDDPDWDIRIDGNENRTYGLHALIEGVWDAKTEKSDNYVTFNIKIN